MIDLNFAPLEQNGNPGLIPPGSCVVVQMHIVEPPAGREGSEPLVTLTRTTGLEYIYAELKILYGRYAGSSFFHFFHCGGAQTAGQIKLVNKGKSLLRAILEDKLSIDPKDNSQLAIEKRQIEDVLFFERAIFPVQVGCEYGVGEYSDKLANRIDRIIRPSDPEWNRIWLSKDKEIITNIPFPPQPSASPASNGFSSPAAAPQAAGQLWETRPRKEAGTPSWAKPQHGNDEIPF